MSPNTVSPLRQRMIEDMNARKLGAHSQRNHIDSCKRFAAFIKRSLDTATADDVRRFQLHLADSGISICNRNRIMTGVKFLLRVTLRRLTFASLIRINALMGAQITAVRSAATTPRQYLSHRTGRRRAVLVRAENAPWHWSLETLCANTRGNAADHGAVPQSLKECAKPFRHGF
jgi:hypothetical protein